MQDDDENGTGVVARFFTSAAQGVTPTGAQIGAQIVDANTDDDSSVAATGSDWMDLAGEIYVDNTDSVDQGPESATAHAPRKGRRERKDGHALEHTAYDDLVARDTVKAVSSLQQRTAAAKAQYPAADLLAEDIFNALFNAFPTEREINDPAYVRNGPAIHALMQTREYAELHAQTELDEFGAGIAAAAFVETLTEQIVKEAEQQQQQQQAQQQQGGDPNQGQNPNQGQHQQPDPAAGAGMRNAARNAAAQAQEALAEARDALDTFGDGEEGLRGGGWGTSHAGVSAERGDIRARYKLAAQVSQNQRLQNIAKLAGRMRLVAGAVQRNKATYTPAEIVGVTRGADLRRVLPSQLAYLGDPDLELIFLAQLARRSLLQYELSDQAPTGKGPIIAWEDESGSMDGEPSEWAAAVMLTLRQIAADQGRDFMWGHFAWGEKNIKMSHYPKGKGTPEQILSDAKHFYSGGHTSYVEWMDHSLELVNGSVYNKADVILISDGIAGVPDSVLLHWMETKQAKDFRCNAVMIGGQQHHLNFLRTFSDDAMDINMYGSEGSDTAALNMMFNV